MLCKWLNKMTNNIIKLDHQMKFISKANKIQICKICDGSRDAEECYTYYICQKIIPFWVGNRQAVFAGGGMPH